MGVHYLVRNLENKGGRLPFPQTQNNDNNANNSKYRQIGQGELKYIGFDGSVIIHEEVENNLGVKENATKIVAIAIQYIEQVVMFFNTYNKIIIIHFVIDGKPPCTKNRVEETDKKKDAYSTMPACSKKILHNKIIKYLQKKITSINNNVEYQLKLITNYNIDENIRGEGEIELYKLCQMINNKKSQHKNVIISSDSDLISLMLMNQDTNLVIISPLKKNIYVTNYHLITNALNLKNNTQTLQYLLLHFIFFGSDYNLGIISFPDDNKQKIILNAINNGKSNINDIAQTINRKRKHNEFSTEFLENLKLLLIYEAICAFMYYYDTTNQKDYLLKYSPRLYENSMTKKYISFIQF